MYELVRNIFWAILTELLFVILAIILKDDKRKMTTVLIVGTILAGVVGFLTNSFTRAGNFFLTSPSSSSTDDTSSNYLALQSALDLVTTSSGGIYCQDISSNSCVNYSYGEATIHNNSPYDLILQNDQGCYFNSTQDISKQWDIYSGKQVTVICPLIYNSSENLYDMEITFIYPQSGSNQVREVTVISFQVK